MSASARRRRRKTRRKERMIDRSGTNPARHKSRSGRTGRIHAVQLASRGGGEKRSGEVHRTEIPVRIAPWWRVG